MTRLVPIVALLVLLPASTGDEVLAWSPETRVRIVEDALMLMPETLRTVLTPHVGAIKRGALEPLTAEGTLPHRPPWQGGTLPSEVKVRAGELVAAVDGHARIQEIALRFGALAHFVCDAGYPPLAGDGEDSDRYAHFANLVESRMEKIPFVFYGHGEDEPERDGLEAAVLAILERAREEDRELARAYRAAGENPHPSAFDDRSVPFAIASLSYSRTVTDVVRVWLYAWGQAHGDMGRTPYLHSPPPNRRP